MRFRHADAVNVNNERPALHADQLEINRVKLAEQQLRVSQRTA